MDGIGNHGGGMPHDACYEFYGYKDEIHTRAPKRDATDGAATVCVHNGDFAKNMYLRQMLWQTALLKQE